MENGNKEIQTTDNPEILETESVQEKVKTEVNTSIESKPKEKRCPNCQALLTEKQLFCTECGTSYKKLCPNCRTELREGQAFCTRCGQNIEGRSLGINVDIAQFNADIEKQKKKRKFLPFLFGIIGILVAVAALITNYTIKEKKVEEYISNASSFCSAVLSSGGDMETIGNSIQSAWGKYINNSLYGTYYNGTYIYSIDSAVEAAQEEQSAKISSVKDDDSNIDSLYKSLLVIPDSENQELQEIKDGVKEVYDAYEDMYDVVITVSGNYNSFKSNFSDADSELANAIGKLSNLLN